jgi:hypothetical protein
MSGTFVSDTRLSPVSSGIRHQRGVVETTQFAMLDNTNSLSLRNCPNDDVYSVGFALQIPAFHRRNAIGRIYLACHSKATYDGDSAVLMQTSLTPMIGLSHLYPTARLVCSCVNSEARPRHRRRMLHSLQTWSALKSLRVPRLPAKTSLLLYTIARVNTRSFVL